MAARLLAKNKPLIPLAVCTVFGCALAGGSLARYSFSGHHTAWTTDNTFYWNAISSTQNIKLMGLQGKHKSYNQEEVFKPRSPDDLRGRL